MNILRSEKKRNHIFLRIFRSRKIYGALSQMSVSIASSWNKSFFLFKDARIYVSLK